MTVIVGDNDLFVQADEPLPSQRHGIYESGEDGRVASSMVRRLREKSIRNIVGRTDSV